VDAVDDLRSRYDVVLCEGAGSPAEINLLDHDIVNLRIADEAQIPAVLVGDIELGGVFASLYGTVALLPDALRARVRGFVINRLRGDPALLLDGCAQLRDRTGIPTLGVLPNLGYAFAINVTVPLWDWGAQRSKIRQSQIRQRQAGATLSQAQRQLMSGLYSMYNEALTARAAVDSLRRAAELANESLRLINLRYQAGESQALEVVDAQNTAVTARNAADDAEARYRVAIAQLQTMTGSF